MQVNGVGSGQVRDSYQKQNPYINTSGNKKEEEEANKRLEALGVKVELSSRQKKVQESAQGQVREEKREKAEENFSIFDILKTLWEEAKKLIRDIWYSDTAGEEKSVVETLEGQVPIRVQEISSKPEEPDGTVHIKGTDTTESQQNAAESQQNVAEGAPSWELPDTVLPEELAAELAAEAALNSVAMTTMASAVNPARIEGAAEAVVPGRVEAGADMVTADAVSGKQEGLWEKLKVKFRELFGQLMSDASQTGADAQTQTALQSEEQQAQEEQPSKTEGGFEIPELEGRALHTSHMQDSYNKYGQYSKLAQDPQSTMTLRQ